MNSKNTGLRKIRRFLGNFFLVILAFWLSFWTDIVFPSQEMLNLTHMLVIGGLFLLLKAFVFFRGWINTIISSISLNVILIIGGTFFSPEWQNDPSNQGMKTLGMIIIIWCVITAAVEFFKAGVKTYS